MKNLRFNHRRDANEPLIVEYLEKAGCMVDRINGKDIPDLLCLHPNGKFFLVEVKTPAGKLKPGQRDWFAKARQRNSLVFVCQEVEDVGLALKVVANA